MMKLDELIKLFNELAPIQLSEEWDNPGLLVGDAHKEVNTVYVALDATSEVIEAAHEEGADLILTHHPLIFHGIYSVHSEGYVGKRVMKLIEYGIPLFAMHTDFDITCMGAEAAERLGLMEIKVLEPKFNEDTGLGSYGYLKEDLTLKELAEKTKKDFDLEYVTVYGDTEDTMVKVAVFPGSGSSGIDKACMEGCDVLITGDISHHDGIDALEKGIDIIDAGHYGIEKIFMPFMKQYIESNAPGIRVILDKAERKCFVV